MATTLQELILDIIRTFVILCVFPIVNTAVITHALDICHEDIFCNVVISSLQFFLNHCKIYKNLNISGQIRRIRESFTYWVLNYIIIVKDFVRINRMHEWPRGWVLFYL